MRYRNIEISSTFTRASVPDKQTYICDPYTSIIKLPRRDAHLPELFAISVAPSESNPPSSVPFVIGSGGRRGLNRPPPMRLRNRTKGMAMHLPPHYHSRRTIPPTLSSFSHLSPDRPISPSAPSSKRIFYSFVLFSLRSVVTSRRRFAILFFSQALFFSSTNCFSACCIGKRTGF